MNDNPITVNKIVKLAKELHPAAYSSKFRNSAFVYDGISMLSLYNDDEGWLMARGGPDRGSGGAPRWSPVSSMSEIRRMILECRDVYAASSEEQQRAANERVKTLRQTPKRSLANAIVDRLGLASGTIETNHHDNNEG